MSTFRSRRIAGTSVQVVVAFVLAAVVAVALWWGFVREHAPLGPAGIRVEADFAAAHDGPVPHRFDGGQPANVVAAGGDDRLTIEHGRLTYRPTTPDRAAAYISTPDLRSSVKGMGARFVFKPGAGNVSAVILIVSRGIGQGAPPMTNPLAINFVITPLNWNIAVSRTESAPPEVVAAGSLKQPLRIDGVTAYDARLTIDGAQVTVDVPGTHQVVSDPRFSEWQGSYATFELFSNHGATDSMGAFEKIWATGEQD